tara:strand:+ start:312 stop:590 length:279 start_codon:yes stop_codon:yes gene_type:complete
MEYTVHVYAIVRVPVKVEAESQVDAIEKAEAKVDWYTQFDGDQEWAEENAYYLVDELGDEEYQKSHWYAYVNQDITLIDGQQGEPLSLSTLA